jgi:S-adenosylmethionine:tRNA ribosyltransferase-isomerase
MIGPLSPAMTIGTLGADRIPEDRGVARDEVRLLVSDPGGISHRRFYDLPDLLRSGDLLVVNESATLAASLPARSNLGTFRVSLSTSYGPDLWLVEPRWSYASPGPLPLHPGDRLEIGGVSAQYVADFPQIPRLGFVRVTQQLEPIMEKIGRPIRYGYLAREYPLTEYQTVFARVPGSAEMPSAARPFTRRLVHRLREGGVGIASIVLHAGVSSLEPGDAGPSGAPILPEPYSVSANTVRAIRETRAKGNRVIAVGTTVVRALESASDGCGLRASRGFTRLYLHAARPTRSVDGVITGFHDAASTHLALLASVAGEAGIFAAYQAASESGYLGHEFGDSHLILLR